MASKYFSLTEVMDGLDGSDFEDDSDDDFDGYLDMEECRLEEEQRGEEVDEREMLDVQESVGAEVVVEDTDLSHTLPEYTLQAGCSVPVEMETPLDFFSLLLTDCMLENIVAHTNLNAEQFIEAHELAPHSRVRRWSKSLHDVDELRQFLAIIIIMGLVRHPQIESHWSTQWPYSNTNFSSVS